MVIHQSCSVSSDSIINSLLIVYIVYNLYLFKTDTKLTIGKFIIYYILTSIVVMAKIAYFPLALLSLLIFNRKEISLKKKILFLISIFILVIAVGLLTYKLMMYYITAVNRPAYQDVNATRQIINVLSNPLKYLKTILTTIEQKSYIWLQVFIGSLPGYVHITVNQFIILLYIVMLVISVFYNTWNNYKCF